MKGNSIIAQEILLTQKLSVKVAFDLLIIYNLGRGVGYE